MKEQFAKLVSFVKANKDQIIQKALVGAGVLVGAAVVSVLLANQEQTEMMMDPTCAEPSDEETQPVPAEA